MTVQRNFFISVQRSFLLVKRRRGIRPVHGFARSPMPGLGFSSVSFIFRILDKIFASVSQDKEYRSQWFRLYSIYHYTKSEKWWMIVKSAKRSSHQKYQQSIKWKHSSKEKALSKAIPIYLYSSGGSRGSRRGKRKHQEYKCMCLHVRAGRGRMKGEEDAIIFACHPATASSLRSPLHVRWGQAVKNKPLLRTHKGTWKGHSQHPHSLIVLDHKVTEGWGSSIFQN